MKLVKVISITALMSVSAASSAWWGNGWDRNDGYGWGDGRGYGDGYGYGDGSGYGSGYTRGRGDGRAYGDGDMDGDYVFVVQDPDVVEDVTEVKLTRAKIELPAKVVSPVIP